MKRRNRHGLEMRCRRVLRERRAHWGVGFAVDAAAGHAAGGGEPLQRQQPHGSWSIRRCLLPSPVDHAGKSLESCSAFRQILGLHKTLATLFLLWLWTRFRFDSIPATARRERNRRREPRVRARGDRGRRSYSQARQEGRNPTSKSDGPNSPLAPMAHTLFPAMCFKSFYLQQKKKELCLLRLHKARILVLPLRRGPW